MRTSESSRRAVQSSKEFSDNTCWLNAVAELLWTFCFCITEYMFPLMFKELRDSVRIIQTGGCWCWLSEILSGHWLIWLLFKGGWVTSYSPECQYSFKKATHRIFPLTNSNYFTFLARVTEVLSGVLYLTFLDTNPATCARQLHVGWVPL